MLRFVRLTGGALGVILALSFASFDAPGGAFFAPTLEGRLLLAAWVCAWLVLGYAILPYITVEPTARLIRAVGDLSTGEFVTAIVGLLLGLLIGMLLGLPLSNFPDPFHWILPLLVSVFLGLGMMGLTVAKRHDLLAALACSGLLSRDALSDLDGCRDAAAGDLRGHERRDRRARHGRGRFRVPVRHAGRAALRARRAPAHRRRLGSRPAQPRPARPGDPVRAPEGPPHLARADRRGRLGGTAIDAKLVLLARRRDAAVLTTDYNLNRVAQLQGVRVMNLNQLANAIKPAFLPGEGVRVKVVQQGKEPGQGVAFLDDGTMIVVEGGGSFLQRELDVTVTRVLQTVAGRMVFAQPAGSTQ